MKYIHIIMIICALALAACGDSAPTVPGDFVVNAVSASSINLSWTKPTNYTKIDSYEIWRNNKYKDDSYSTGYLDRGLRNSTTYCYSVKALASGEESDFTDTLCAKTFFYDDTGPPTTPGGLIANAISDTKIELTWDPSTDDLQVAGYKVFRDNAYINSVASNMLTDTGLVNSTQYCYYVTAYDQLNQESEASTTDCDWTLAP